MVRNDFFDKYPDLLPYESVVDAVAVNEMLEVSENSGWFDFVGQHPAWAIAVKLQASGYKGGSREAVLEIFAKAARQELARQQQAPPISKTQVPTDAGSNTASESTPPSQMSPWKRALTPAGSAFGIGVVAGIASATSVQMDVPTSVKLLFDGLMAVVAGLLLAVPTYLVVGLQSAAKGERKADK